MSDPSDIIALMEAPRGNVRYKLTERLRVVRNAGVFWTLTFSPQRFARGAFEEGADRTIVVTVASSDLPQIDPSRDYLRDEIEAMRTPRPKGTWMGGNRYRGGRSKSPELILGAERYRSEFSRGSS
jgi:hypothetical protein